MSMEQTQKSEPHLEQPRQCQRCGSRLEENDARCTVCRHEGMDPQEYAKLFWDEA